MAQFRRVTPVLRHNFSRRPFFHFSRYLVGEHFGKTKLLNLRRPWNRFRILKCITLLTFFVGVIIYCDCLEINVKI